MRIALSIAVGAVFAAMPISFTHAEAESAALKSARIELSTDAKPDYVLASLHAGAELQNVRFRFDNEPWQPTILRDKEDSTYAMKHTRAGFAGRRVLASAQDPKTEQWIVISGEINADEQFEEQERKIVDNDDAATTNALIDILDDSMGQGGYQGEFFAQLNSYRARSGRAPLTYDGSLEAIAARNNQAGGYHAYTGGTPQIWAMGSSAVSGTIRQWQNSPPHNAIMLGGYSRVGIAHDGRNWTANFR